MKKWKEIPGNEKWMIVLIGLLLIGILIRWSAVKEGIGRGFNWFRSEETESVLPSDAVPDEQPEALIEIVE